MLKFINSFSTDLIEIRCLHNDEKKLPGKFVVLDKMDVVAQAGHMTNEYSKIQSNTCVLCMSWCPGKNNLCMLHALAVCSCSVLSALAAGKYKHVVYGCALLIEFKADSSKLYSCRQCALLILE